MFAFMLKHEDFSRDRVSGLDANRTKKRLTEELGAHLNSARYGCTKTPDEWLKSWQDWKSEMKAKGLRMNKIWPGAGLGPKSLSSLEMNLLEFLRAEMVEGEPEVADRLQVSEDLPLEEQIQEEKPSVPETPQQSRTHPDPLYAIHARQAAAIEDVATGVHSIAAALHQIAAALQPKRSPLKEG